MFIESGIYILITLRTCLGDAFSNGTNNVTYEKMCTKTIPIEQTFTVSYHAIVSTMTYNWGYYTEVSWYVTRYRQEKRKVTKSYPACCPNLIEVNNRCIAENCTCPDHSLGGCEKDIGKCTCLQCKQGYDCHKECNTGWYGFNCSFPCNCTSSQICNPVSGDCTCKPGRQGQDCKQDCNEGWYGLNCSYPCNCTRSQICNSVSGDCTCNPGIKGQDFKQDCICKQPGTSNCDDQRQTCFCSDELKDGACSSANLTTVEQIRSFMTTICNCQIDDAFCVPTNESCYCKNGWTGDQCEIAIAKKRFSFGYIIGGVAGFLVLIVLVVVVIAVFFCKRRQRTNDAYTVVVYETPDASRNVYYSPLSSNLHKNENVGGNETNTDHHVAIKPSDSFDDASGSQYKNTRGGLQYKEYSKAQYEEVEYLQN